MKKQLYFVFSIISLCFLSCNKDIIRNGEIQSQKEVKISVSGLNVTENMPEMKNVLLALFKDSICYSVNSYVQLPDDLSLDLLNSPDIHILCIANNANLFNLSTISKGFHLLGLESITSSPKTDLLNEAEAFSILQKYNPGEASQIDLTLERAVARVDVVTNDPQNVKVKSISIDKTPSKTPLLSSKVKNEDLISRTHQADSLGHGALFLFEQQNVSAVFRLEVEYKGVSNIVMCNAPQSILRNRVYTVNVKNIGGSLKATINITDWETGEAVNATPTQLKILLNKECSTLPVDAVWDTLANTITLTHSTKELELGFLTSFPISLKVEGGTDVTVTPKEMVTKDSLIMSKFQISLKGNPIGSPETRFYLYPRNGNHQFPYSKPLQLIIKENPNQMLGLIKNKFNSGFKAEFSDYIDGELGSLVLKSSYKASLVLSDTTQKWIRLRETTTGTFKIEGGFRANDRTIEGVKQEASLIITDSVGREETYTISRLNKTLPVVQFDTLYWMQFNLRGNSKSFDDQTQCYETDILSYLQTVSDSALVCLAGDGYKTSNTTGLKLKKHNDSFSFENYNTTSGSGQPINQLNPTAHCPSGYRMPTQEEFKYFLDKSNNNITISTNDSIKTYTNNQNKQVVLTQYSRKNVSYQGVSFGEMRIYSFEVDNKKIVFHFPGHQWNNSNNTSGNWTSDAIFSVITSGTKSYGFKNRLVEYVDNSAPKTRSLRCVKIPTFSY